MEITGYKISSSVNQEQKFAIIFFHEDKEFEIDVTKEILKVPNNQYTDGVNTYSLSVKGLVNIATKKVEKVDETTLIPLRHLKMMELIKSEEIYQTALKMVNNDNN